MSMTLEMIAERIELLEKQIQIIISERTDDESKEDKETKTKGKAKKDKVDKEDKTKSKRAPSGYNLFCKATRDQAKESIIEEEELEEGKKPSNQAIMSKLGTMWKELESEERVQWQDKAKSLKDEVDVEVEVE